MNGTTSLVACHDCDLLQHRHKLPVGNVARCVRCGAVLYSNLPDSVERTVALSFASLVLFVCANVFPFLALEIGGLQSNAGILGAAFAMYQGGMWEVALLVFFTCIAAPFLQISMMLYIFLPIMFGKRPHFMVAVFRILRTIQSWNMIEVFMLGILVAMVKLGNLATIIPGIAFWTFLALIFVMAGAAVSMDPEVVWETADQP